MDTSNLQGLLRSAACAVLLAAPLAACSDDESNQGGDRDGGRTFGSGPLSLLECDERGGFQAFGTDEGASSETTRCPAGTDLIGPIHDIDIFALCCFIGYEPCKPQRVQVGSTCDTAIAYYWLGRGCAPIRECACFGPDCDEGYATEDECTDAHEGCEAGILPCGTLTGSGCPPDRYCAEAGCSATNSGGLCVPIPTACDDSLEPVCGCDGVTYDNECELAKARKSRRSFSACEAPADP